jgi:hypothetical protein
LERIPESPIEVLSLDAEAESLAAESIRDGAVGKNQRADALHRAIATAARVDVLVSWNFKHIVNLRRIHAFNAVNVKQRAGQTCLIAFTVIGTPAHACSDWLRRPRARPMCLGLYPVVADGRLAHAHGDHWHVVQSL